jgi:hypothetical protein
MKVIYFLFRIINGALLSKREKTNMLLDQEIFYLLELVSEDNYFEKIVKYRYEFDEFFKTFIGTGNALIFREIFRETY